MQGSRPYATWHQAQQQHAERQHTQQKDVMQNGVYTNNTQSDGLRDANEDNYEMVE